MSGKEVSTYCSLTLLIENFEWFESDSESHCPLSLTLLKSNSGLIKVDIWMRVHLSSFYPLYFTVIHSLEWT
jgi:hypothetical protein